MKHFVSPSFQSGAKNGLPFLVGPRTAKLWLLLVLQAQPLNAKLKVSRIQRRKNNTNSINTLIMPTSTSTRRLRFAPLGKESFGATLKFYFVLKIFRTLKISDAKTSDNILSDFFLASTVTILLFPYRQAEMPRSYTSSSWPAPRPSCRRPGARRWVDEYKAWPIRWLVPVLRTQISNRCF